ncbi:MAG TPA: DoxX family protein [Candidatus Angelobacter sp.]|nr:DoxX family protein [Candidatus Angelobacter sp.]
MQSATQTASASGARIWTGRVLTALALLFLLFDSGIKILNLAPAVQGTVGLGFQPSVVVPIGIVLLVCAILYIIPRTAILGAVLLTGYLGGAVASQVRAGNPLFSHVLFPVYFAFLVWGGLYLRDARLRALVPLRRSNQQ